MDHTPGRPSRTSSGARTPAQTPVTPGAGGRLAGHSRTPSSGGVTPGTPASGQARRSGRGSLASLGSSNESKSSPFARSLSNTTPLSPGGRSLVSQTSLRSYPASPHHPNGGVYQQHHLPTPPPAPVAPPVVHPKSRWYAIYDYQAQGEDELLLNKGDVIEVLSKDYKISGDEGWWTGKCDGKVGVFPCNFVAPCDLDFSNLPKEELRRFYPPHISFAELEVRRSLASAASARFTAGSTAAPRLL
jgi:hypothetical protein